jgi:hypothetical protein
MYNEFGFPEEEKIQPVQTIPPPMRLPEEAPADQGWASKFNQAVKKVARKIPGTGRLVGEEEEQTSQEPRGAWDTQAGRYANDPIVDQPTQAEMDSVQQQYITQAIESPETHGTFDDWLREVEQDPNFEPQSGMMLTQSQTKGMTEESKQRMAQAEMNYGEAAAVYESLKSQVNQERALRLEQSLNDYIDSTGADFEAFNKGYEKIREDLDKVGDKIEALSNKSIDPDRYVKNMDKTEKTTHALLSFLEAFGNSFTGKEGNFFLEKLQRDIQQDIQLQERDILMQIEGQKTKASLLKEKLQEHSSLYNAKKALEAETLMAVVKKVEARAEADTSGLYEERANVVLSEAGKRIAEIQADMLTNSFQMVTAEQPSNQILDIVPPDRAVEVAGQIFGTYTKEDAVKLKEDLGNYNATKAAIERINKLVEDAGKGRLLPTARSEIQTNANALKINLNNLLGGGSNLPRQLTDSLNQMVSNPSDLRPWKNNMGQLTKIADSAAQSVLDSRGVIPTGLTRGEYNKILTSGGFPQ